MKYYPEKPHTITLTEEPLIHDAVSLSDVQLGRYTEIGAGSLLEHTILDDYSYCGPSCIFQNSDIGKFANIAAQVRLGPTHHPLDRPTMHHFTYRRRMYMLDTQDDTLFFTQREMRRVRIGHDTWIGHGAIVMPGVSIGDGAVIGSGAVVTKDIPDYTIAVGIPARVVRIRFTEKQIAQLKKIAWWDWPHSRLKDHLEKFCGSAEAFIEQFGEEY